MSIPAGTQMFPGGAGVSPGGFPQAPVTPPPLASAFTWVNQGTATEASGFGSTLVMNVPLETGGLNWRLFGVPQANTPFTVTGLLKLGGYQVNTSTFGLYLYDGASSKIVGFEWLCQSSFLLNLRVEHMNSVTSDNSTPFDVQFAAEVGFPIWQRINYDGTNFNFQYSVDGSYFKQLYSESATAWLGLSNLSVCWGGLNGAPSADIDIFLASWNVTTP